MFENLRFFFHSLTSLNPGISSAMNFDLSFEKKKNFIQFHFLFKLLFHQFWFLFINEMLLELNNNYSKLLILPSSSTSCSGSFLTLFTSSDIFSDKNSQKNHQNYFGDPWNVFDFIIVLGSLIDIVYTEYNVSRFTGVCYGDFIIYFMITSDSGFLPLILVVTISVDCL